MDLSEMLANWKAGKLRQPPTKPLLGRLEKAHKSKVERIRESRTMTPEMKRLEENEARATYRSEWFKLKRDISTQMEADEETARRAANPPATSEQLERMNLLSGIHVPRWERSAGNLVADAISFEQQGDEAGLRLAQQHVGVLEPSQRSKAAASIGEALDAFKTDEQRNAERQARSLAKERERFELGTGVRENFIRKSTEPIQPPRAAPSPMAAPQR